MSRADPVDLIAALFLVVLLVGIAAGALAAARADRVTRERAARGERVDPSS